MFNSSVVEKKRQIASSTFSASELQFNPNLQLSVLKEVLHEAIAPAIAQPNSNRTYGGRVVDYETEKGHWSQCHENDIAKVILVSDPASHVNMGTLHPSGSLYEQSVDVARARLEHEMFRKVMEKYGVEVHTVRSILQMGCDSDVRARLALEDLAFRCMAYVFDSKNSDVVLDAADEYLLSDEYKAQTIAAMDTQHLVEIVLTRPTITLVKSDKDTPLTATSWTFQPLANLTFTRDQQITTNKGIVMARMSSPQRKFEVELMKFCFEKLDIPVIGEIPSPGTLEGGEFFPAGEDLCLIGVGLRTNYAACLHMMENDLWGTRRVGIVKDLFERSQDRMHLDCVFNIASFDCTVMLEDIMGKDSKIRRLVDEWVRGDDGKYRLSRHDVEFVEYIQDEGYHVIPVSAKNQLEYGCNFLNLGDSNIITVHKETARQMAREPLISGNIELIEYRSITSMYGSVHCSSQVIKRVPQPSTKKTTGRSMSTSKLVLPNVDAATVRPPVSGKSSPKNFGNGDMHTLLCPVFSPSPAGPTKPPQSTNSAIMVVPTAFYSHNSWEVQQFYSKGSEAERKLSCRVLHGMFLEEYSNLHAALTNTVGMDIHLFHHEVHHNTPNGLFCADVVTTHSAGELATTSVPTAVIYKMKEENRQNEVRDMMRSRLAERYKLIVDMPKEYPDAGPLEGAGSLALYRPSRTAYFSTSPHSSPETAKLWAQRTGYTLVTFQAEIKGQAVVHVNHILSIGSRFAIFCSAAVPNATERETVIKKLKADGLEVIDITVEQAGNYCGEVVEVASARREPVLVMSTRAYKSFTPEQLSRLSDTISTIVHEDLGMIERVGNGSLASLLLPLF